MANQAQFEQIIFHVGDTVKIDYKIIEKEKKAGRTKRSVREEIKERIQPFEGIVLAIRGREENRTFTVRKMATGQIGVERIFPLNSPWIKKIAVKQRGKVRRSKLYYLRKRKNLDVKQFKRAKTKGAKRGRRSRKAS